MAERKRYRPYVQQAVNGNGMLPGDEDLIVPDGANLWEGEATMDDLKRVRAYNLAVKNGQTPPDDGYYHHRDDERDIMAALGISKQQPQQQNILQMSDQQFQQQDEAGTFANPRKINRDFVPLPEEEGLGYGIIEDGLIGGVAGLVGKGIAKGFNQGKKVLGNTMSKRTKIKADKAKDDLHKRTMEKNRSQYIKQTSRNAKREAKLQRPLEETYDQKWDRLATDYKNNTVPPSRTAVNSEEEIRAVARMMGNKFRSN